MDDSDKANVLATGYRDGERDAAKGKLLAQNPYRHISYDLAIQWELGWRDYHLKKQQEDKS